MAHFKLKFLGDCPAAGNLLSLDVMYRKFIPGLPVYTSLCTQTHPLYFTWVG